MAVRQILTALPAGFPRAVLISQRLDGGRYDRLVQQMRARRSPVHLAEASTKIQPGYVYIVPPESASIAHGSNVGLLAVDALPADDSAALMLSGADPALVDAAMAHASAVLVAGQSPVATTRPRPWRPSARGATAAAPQGIRPVAAAALAGLTTLRNHRRCPTPMLPIIKRKTSGVLIQYRGRPLVAAHATIARSDRTPTPNRSPTRPWVASAGAAAGAPLIAFARLSGIASGEARVASVARSSCSRPLRRCEGAVLRHADAGLPGAW